MFEYVDPKELKAPRFTLEGDVYALGWNDGLDAVFENAPRVKAVPEEAIKVTEELLKAWINGAERKLGLAIADHDSATAEIKRSEVLTFKFALDVVEKLKHYGEDGSEMKCSEE